MARIKPQALLQQNKKKKAPGSISIPTIALYSVVMVFFLFATYRHWSQRIIHCKLCGLMVVGNDTDKLLHKSWCYTGLDSLQGIMLDQGSCIDTCCTFCRKLDAMGYKRGHFVLIAKIIISALGYLMLGTFIYVLIVDGSTFNANVLSRCMIATTTDFYFCIVTVAVWIAYKESRWISAFFWILSLLSFWRESWYEKLQRWDDALKAYTAKSAQATSQRLILDTTLGKWGW
ncbi:hypothetical protein Lser_V15G00574 [Lactuca serriola]